MRWLEKLVEDPHQRVVVFWSEHLDNKHLASCIFQLTLVMKVPPGRSHSTASFSAISTSRATEDQGFDLEEEYREKSSLECQKDNVIEIRKGDS